ncbi:fungal-specific transcription factor domain-containing protein [Plectosphaerella plurivora]|uniref:Fungal-specific transcription factor domain-containing protein n=1 Tax=Plectosphaerella plurivora TaxID=936078 RepID=A0A9P8V1N4_9PEZI|nr:fungal-specific transcription factor domain-containing protein [Plectosphaerella plurivora]
MAPAPTMDTPAATPRVVRRRAGVACVHCRKRKVRCDVSQRGSPCAICYLDNLDCRVVPRVNRRSDLLPGDNGASPEDGFDEEAFRQAFSHAESCVDDHFSPEIIEEVPEEPQMSVDDTEPTRSAAPPPPSTTRHRPLRQQPPDVLYTHYPCLRLGNMSSLSARDVNVLEAECTLRVPTRDALEEFLRQYFRHVHPLLPLIHEGEFWMRYARKDASEASGSGISLLLLQAMLFAACNFVSLDTIQACGLGSMREARSELYRRAKLLHDFDAEASPYTLAQSALLLSFWLPPEDPRGRRPNTSWLITAIRHAKDAGAHRYASPSLMSKPTPRGRQSHQNKLKRLWWCCIIRDRVISLGLRRCTQITRQTFDFDTSPTLEAADLADEIHRSRVYNVETKKSLVQLCVRFVRLCVILTDLLSLTPYPEDGDAWALDRSGRAERSSVSELGWELTTWFTDMRREFPSDVRPKQTDTIRFFSRTVLLYYYTSVASLSQYKMLRGAVLSTAGSDMTEGYAELQTAISGFADCMQQLVDMRLAHCLPISTSAFSVLPLLLHGSSLQENDSTNPRRKDEHLEKRQKQHDVLTEAMRIVGLQYGGVKWFAVVVRQVGQLARKWATPGEGSPAALLRLVLTADMSLSRADHPYNGALPPSLTALLDAKPRGAEKRPGYASVVNPTDMLSWTELDRLLDVDLVCFDDVEGMGPMDGDLDPTLPTWRDTGDIQAVVDTLDSVSEEGDNVGRDLFTPDVGPGVVEEEAEGMALEV